MALQFGKDIALLGVGAAATATGTTLSSTPAFNITGYDGLAALVTVGVTATNNHLVWTVSTASGGTFSDVAGTGATCHTAQVMSEIRRPAGGPWFKANLRQGASGQHTQIYVFGINPVVRPTTGNSTLLTYRYKSDAGTGTATST